MEPGSADHLEEEEVKGEVKRRLLALLRARASRSIEMSDIASCDSSIRELSRRYAALTKTSQRKGYIHRCIRDACEGLLRIDQRGENRSTNPIIHLMEEQEQEQQAAVPAAEEPAVPAAELFPARAPPALPAKAGAAAASSSGFYLTEPRPLPRIGGAPLQGTASGGQSWTAERAFDIDPRSFEVGGGFHHGVEHDNYQEGWWRREEVGRGSGGKGRGWGNKGRGRQGGGGRRGGHQIGW
jgi:hypothetical protein